jgi:hypothetical protein
LFGGTGVELILARHILYYLSHSLNLKPLLKKQEAVVEDIGEIARLTAFYSLGSAAKGSRIVSGILSPKGHKIQNWERYIFKVNSFS